VKIYFSLQTEKIDASQKYLLVFEISGFPLRLELFTGHRTFTSLLKAVLGEHVRNVGCGLD
jgi:hypothetical protein